MFPVLSQLQAQTQPELLYRVYLTLPEMSAPDKRGDYHVGTISSSMRSISTTVTAHTRATVAVKTRSTAST